MSPLIIAILVILAWVLIYAILKPLDGTDFFMFKVDWYKPAGACSLIVYFIILMAILYLIYIIVT